MTPSPTASAAAESGSALSTWIWLVLALVLLVVFLFFRRRAAFEAHLDQHRVTWLAHADQQTASARALAAEISTGRQAPGPTDAIAAGLRKRSEKLAAKIDRLAAAAVTSDDAVRARRVAAALRGVGATGLTTGDADVLSRQAAADAELNAALRDLERPDGVGDR